MSNHAPGQTVEVAAGLIWRNGKLLLCQRPASKPMGGFWEFPGGKLEAGERPEQALARELREELAIDAKNINFCQTVKHHYADNNLTVILHFLTVGEFAGEPDAREGQAMEWLTPRGALNLPLLEADLAILRHLANAGA